MNIHLLFSSYQKNPGQGTDNAKRRELPLHQIRIKELSLQLITFSPFSTDESLTVISENKYYRPEIITKGIAFVYTIDKICAVKKDKV